MTRGLASVVGAYLLGAIPWSYLLPRLAGRDIRRLGDGNVGAHNVARHVGRAWGCLALGLDTGKGALAVWLARRVAGPGWWSVLAGWSAVLGHNYPIWLRLRGGKGLATGLGVVLAWFPGLAWPVLGGAVLLIGATRNLAFSAAAVGLAVSGVVARQGRGLSYTVATPGILLLMAWKQVPELVRMWRAAPDKRDLILSRWIMDRDARL